MNVSLNLVSTLERVRIYKEATDASVNRDSSASIARSVGISVGNCFVYYLINLLPFKKHHFHPYLLQLSEGLIHTKK